MAFRDTFEELYRDLCHKFDSIMSAMVYLLENSLFPDEDITEQDMQQNLLEQNMNETLNKKLTSHLKKKTGWMFKNLEGNKNDNPREQLKYFPFVGFTKDCKERCNKDQLEKEESE